MESGNEAMLQQFYSKGNIAAVLGDIHFKAAIQEEYKELGASTQALWERPDAEMIVRAVAKACSVKPHTIKERKQGRQTSNLPRKLAMYYCQHIGDLSLQSIAQYFGLSHPGSVSTAVNDIRNRMSEGELKRETKAIDRILNIIK